MALLQGSGGLAVNKAVTSLSLISLMITPLSYLLMAIPDTFASTGCLDRIQDFLKSPIRLGKRSRYVSLCFFYPRSPNPWPGGRSIIFFIFQRMLMK
jgi:hypothetical protein